jgi:hypothetical protein
MGQAVGMPVLDPTLRLLEPKVGDELYPYYFPNAAKLRSVTS